MPGMPSIPVTCWQVAQHPEAICVKGWGGGMHNPMPPATPRSLPPSGLQHCGQSQGQEPPAGSPLEVQDLVLSPPSLLTASISLVTLPSPRLAPVLPVVTPQLAPSRVAAPPAQVLQLSTTEKVLLPYGFTVAPAQPSPLLPAMEVTVGEVCKSGVFCGVVHGVCHPPAHPPARGTLPARCPQPLRLALAAFSLVLLCSAAVAP